MKSSLCTCSCVCVCVCACVALEGSPCAAAGMPVNEPLVVTHVNGLDVCPEECRSTAERSAGGNSWGKAIVPLLMDDSTMECMVTFVTPQPHEAKEES